MKEKIKCSECEFCRSLRPRNNSRAEFTCKHPDQMYILNYFHEHRIVKHPVQTATFRGQQGRISRPVKAILSGRL